MGLFSFLFSKHKLLRTTYEAETFRAVFREDEELFLRVEKGEELKRYRELEEYVNSAQFKERRKEIEQLSYKDSEYYKAERQYKALLKVRKLQSYLLIADSEELKGYERVKALPEYQEYQKLKVMVMSAGFDKKLHAVEYKAYQEKIRQGQIDRAKNMISKNGKIKKNRKNPNDPSRFTKRTSITANGEVAEEEIYEIDQEAIDKEAMYDGFYAVSTDMEGDVAEIIAINKRRWQIEECFRIMKTDFDDLFLVPSDISNIRI